MIHKKPSALIILDGFGYNPCNDYNPINSETMPHYFQFLEKYPHTLLNASGAAVGLLEGMAGNSLVGHLTIGSGRIMEQPISFFHRAIHNGELAHNKVLVKRLRELCGTNKRLHLMGLLSDGASHSHEELLYELMRIAHKEGVKQIIVHPFLDGRDAPPRSAATYLAHLNQVCAEVGAVIGSIQGRSFAMDRTNNYEVIQKAFQALTTPTPVYTGGWHQLISAYYEKNITDEFIPPTALVPESYIQDGDGLIFFNIRADRARMLTMMFLEAKHPQLAWFITSIPYHPQFSTDVLYKSQPLFDTLPDVLRAHHKSSCYVAESEKYAHVTYFFNGGKEITNPHDMYVVVPSPPPAEFEKTPQLAAYDITSMTLCSLQSNPRDFYLINYANADIVGHTGNLSATKEALFDLDLELVKVINYIVGMGGTIYLTSDHGKAELMFDQVTQQPFTRHTVNSVPFIVINRDIPSSYKIPLCQLSDIAPFILNNMHLPIPKAMKKRA